MEHAQPYFNRLQAFKGKPLIALGSPHTGLFISATAVPHCRIHHRDRVRKRSKQEYNHKRSKLKLNIQEFVPKCPADLNIKLS